MFFHLSSPKHSFFPEFSRVFRVGSRHYPSGLSAWEVSGGSPTVKPSRPGHNQCNEK